MVRLSDLSEHDRKHLESKLQPPLGPTPWVHSEKALSDKRIAIVTTAGLNYRNDRKFNLIDASYRAIPKAIDTASILMSHSSVNFDRTGYQEDINVVFPVDRFKALEADGVIGSLADVNYSFMGGGLLPHVYEESARELASVLRADQVDAVMIIPVCPNCSRTVCGISYYLESEGIQTVGIALFRQIAESMRPPRILWVSFPLGRPLGKPGDAEFQTKVIESGLKLLVKPKGPILEDYPIDLPEAIDMEPPACPVSFARETPIDTWRAKLAKEVASLATWYELGLERRGRTSVGCCDSSITEILARLADWLDDAGDFPDHVWLKFALEDLKAFYSEAIMAKPGDYPLGYVDHIIFHETYLGELITHVVDLLESDERTQPLVRAIASRDQLQRSTGNWAIDETGAMISPANSGKN